MSVERPQQLHLRKPRRIGERREWSEPGQSGIHLHGQCFQARNTVQDDVEELQARQYWRADWRSDATVDTRFDLGNASSLGA